MTLMVKMWYNYTSRQPQNVCRGDVISIPRHVTRKDKFLMPRHSTRPTSFPPNLENYAPWVAAFGLSAPYGECQCGCGQPAPIAKKTERKKMLAKGEPVRFIIHHHWRIHDPVPDGYKKCGACNRVLLPNDFHKSGRERDCLATRCKECTRAFVRSYKERRREQYADYDRNRMLVPGAKERRSRNAELYRKKNPEKYFARRATAGAVSSGQLKKLPCQFCGDAKSQAHHHDYSKPLDVIWVCFKCHRERFHGQRIREVRQNDGD